MGDFRVSKGFAFGPYGTAAATSSQHLIVPGDTTPDVTNGTFFVTANTSATTITYFDVLGPGGVVSTAHNGKVVELLFQDALTTVQNGGNLYLSDTQGALPARSTLRFIYYNSAWIETSRGHNDQTPQAAGGAVRTVSYSGSGTMGATLNVATANVVYFTASALATVINGFTGGTSAQTIRLISLSVGSTLFIAQSAGVLTLPGTTTALLSNSASYEFTTRNGVEWYMEAGIVSP